MKWDQNRLDQIRRGQDRALANRKMLSERLKQRAAATLAAVPSVSDRTASTRQPYADLDIKEAVEAARRLRLIPLEPGVLSRASPNRPTLELLELFLEVLKSRKSEAVLQWPVGEREMTVVHPLGMLAVLCASAPRFGGQYIWCPAVRDFRTLYFPWRAGSAALQGRLLVDRAELWERNKHHLGRQYAKQPEFSAELGWLHETLGHLGQLRLRDASKPHLAHPTLAEIYPVFVAEGGELAGFAFQRSQDELFGRVRHGAGLDRLVDHRGALSRPGSAPFALFGVAANADYQRVLANSAMSAPLGRAPDICILDLGPAALRRLGHDWEGQVERFFDAVRSRFNDVPAIVMTRDVYAYGRVRRLLDGSGQGVRRSKQPDASVRQSVVLRRSGEPLAPDPAIGQLLPVEVQVCSIAGAGVEALVSLTEAARKVRDPIVAGALRRSIGGLRAALRLPCGFSTAYDFLSEEQGQAAAEAFLEYRSRATVLGPVRVALSSGVGGAERESLLRAEKVVQRAFDTLENETPIGSLVQELADRLARKSSRSVFVFGNGLERRLGEQRLTKAGEAGRTIERRLRTGHMVLVSAEEVEQRLAAIEGTRDRNTWKRLVLIAPSHDGLGMILVRSWLPEDLVIVCDRAFALRLVTMYRSLASEPGLLGDGRVGDRLAKLVVAARREAEARAVAPVELELEEYPAFDAAEEEIDLTGDGDEDDSRELVLLRLESGRRLRARPGSAVIRYRRQAEINPFERAVAREVRQGDVIVVPDRAFVEEARRILPVRVLAQNRVELFHTIIEDALPNIPGTTLNAKARYLLKQLQSRGGRTETAAAVLDWLKVEERKDTPREKLRPHAPGGRREFDLLMGLLNAPAAVANRIWTEGIQPLRIDRRRAGLRMAQAFISVLVDPHAAASALDAGVRERIGELCNRAVEYLDTVSGCQRYEEREIELAKGQKAKSKPELPIDIEI